MKTQNIVVAFDFSELGDAVLARAAALVTRAPFHVLHVVTVLDPHAGISALPADSKIDYRYADRVRDLMAERVRHAFGTTEISQEIHFFMHARIGKPSAEILDLAKEVGADLVLVGTRGATGLDRLLMGSTAEHVVREAGCPVLVVRTKRYEDVELEPVIAVDGHSHRYRPYRIGYKNNQAVVHPPDWTLMP